MANYEDLTKDELLEEARKRELSGYSDKNKKDLADLLKSDDESDGDKENLSDSSEEALEKLDDASEDLAAVELDAHGPLKLQSPNDRIMTGAVNEEQAKEQKKLLEENMPEGGHTGNFTEAGTPLSTGEADEQSVAKAKGELKTNLADSDDRELYEVLPEHVIDFPAPRNADQEEEVVLQVEPSGSPLGNPVIGGGSKSGDVYSQKSVLYTDGLSGGADHNLERAYQIPTQLKSTDSAERNAGKESDSRG